MYTYAYVYIHDTRQTGRRIASTSSTRHIKAARVIHTHKYACTHSSQPTRVHIYVHTNTYIHMYSSRHIYIYIYIYILSHTYITTGRLADAPLVDELHDTVQQHVSYIYTTTYAHSHINPHASVFVISTHTHEDPYSDTYLRIHT